MYQYLDQQIEQIGNDDGESKPGFSPVTVDEEKQRCQNDGKGPNDGIIKTTNAFHQ